MIRFKVLFGLSLLLLTTAIAAPQWGFFGHRRINRLATFTLDAEMMPFFRANIDFLAEHAVDPDKRRYATKFEAVRHYIDLDHWGELPYENVPRGFVDAMIWQAEILVVGTKQDTIRWAVDTVFHEDPEKPFDFDTQVLLTNGEEVADVSLGALRAWWYGNVLPERYEDRILVEPDSLATLGLLPAGVRLGPDGTIPSSSIDRVEVIDHFSEYGILPYHLLAYHTRLTRAFESGDPALILRIAAEMGHYVGDAHVPLHTTENYNGQLTDQVGIHGFWESRLPELFADEEYDYFVGEAEYIEDPKQYYWDIVLASHRLVDSVLNSEQRLRQTYPVDQQMCSDIRLGREIKTQCAEFAEAWSEEMNGMVEERFRAAIRSVGSVWYSCWVDAGQPNLDLMLRREVVLTDSLTLGGSIKGRPHE